MGKITTKAIVKNIGDILMEAKGLIKRDEIRSIELEGMVDTGAAFLCLPPDIIEKLGLVYSHTIKVKTANGRVKRRIFNAGEIVIQDRSIVMPVMENDATTPTLIGHLVLEACDLVINPKEQRITGNPEHDGKWVIECYNVQKV